MFTYTKKAIKTNTFQQSIFILISLKRKKKQQLYHLFVDSSETIINRSLNKNTYCHCSYAIISWTEEKKIQSIKILKEKGEFISGKISLKLFNEINDREWNVFLQMVYELLVNCNAKQAILIFFLYLLLFLTFSDWVLFKWWTFSLTSFFFFLNNSTYYSYYVHRIRTQINNIYQIRINCLNWKRKQLNLT